MSRHQSRHALKTAYYTLKGAAKNLSTLHGNYDYERFVLLGRSRVGTNFLMRSLNDHEQIRMYGEIFRAHNEAVRGVDPVHFLETNVFWRHPPRLKAVGFKLFYYHGHEDDWQRLWPYLQSETDIKIIHLKRRNILKTHLSRVLAGETSKWINTSGQQAKTAVSSVTLDYEACLQAFRETRGWEQQYDAFFADHDLLQLFYEDLSAQYEREMIRVQRFLGVDESVVQPSTYKQRKRPLSQMINNFEALKARFAGTPWAEFFQEA